MYRSKKYDSCRRYSATIFTTKFCRLRGSKELICLNTSSVKSALRSICVFKTSLEKMNYWLHRTRCEGLNTSSQLLNFTRVWSSLRESQYLICTAQPHDRRHIIVSMLCPLAISNSTQAIIQAIKRCHNASST